MSGDHQPLIGREFAENFIRWASLELTRMEEKAFKVMPLSEPPTRIRWVGFDDGDDQVTEDG